MLSLLKYWRLWLPIVAFIAAMFALELYVNSERDKAVTAVKEQITATTKEQVKKDEQIVYDAYVSNGTIVEYVDSVYSFPESRTADNGDRLQRTEEGAGITERGASGASVGTSDELSNQEVDFIRSHAGILQ